MKIHRLVFRDIDKDKFDEVANSVKTIETRAATYKFLNIKPGDKLKIVCGNESIEKLVTRVNHYPSIDNMLDNLPLNKILPFAKNREDAFKIYYGFPGYKEKIEKHGIMAFKLK
jgi:ASC-1-like (ASCH) protein